MHMFSGQGGNPSNAPMMGPGQDSNMAYGNNPNMGGPGGMAGPPSGYEPVGGPPPPGPGGYPPNNYAGTPPGYNPQTFPNGQNFPNAPPMPTAGYARISSTNPMNLIWFAAACSVMIGALISFFSELFSFEWVDALEMGYLFIFGFLLAVMDTPLFNQVAIVSELRTAIGKYIAILQRVTGKGAAYIFLGCALWSSMFANVEGGFLLFLAVLIGLFVVIIGAFSLVIAILKSRNLDLVRKELMKDPQSLKQVYDMHAKMQPTVGLTQEEFKKMTPFARGVSFEQGDIKLIFNALASNPRRDVISLDDLQQWVNGGCMVFI